MLMHLPALFLLVEQRHGNARDMQTLGEELQLFAQHLGQARQTAQAQLLAELGCEQLTLLAAACLSTFEQQITDVQQLQ